MARRELKKYGVQKQEQTNERRKERSAQVKLTLNIALTEFREQHQVIKFSDMQEFCENNPNLSLHLINKWHKLTGHSERFRKFYPFPEGIVPNILNTTVKSLNYYLPKEKFIIAFGSQGAMSLMAIGKKELPYFSVIFKSNKNEFASNVIKEEKNHFTEFIEAYLYAKLIFNDKGKFLGTVVITDVYPLDNYSDTDYATDDDFVCPLPSSFAEKAAANMFKWIGSLFIFRLLQKT